jgi:hypothetical protein
MPNNLYYFDGTGWQPISSGGGGGVGPQGPAGPAGADGKSINVFVQTTAPTIASVGDHWINEAATKTYKSLKQVKTYRTLDDLKRYRTLDDLT